MNENIVKNGMKKTNKSIVRSRFGLILISVVVLGGLGAFVSSRLSPDNTGASNNNSELYTVNRGDLIISVNETGDVKALNSVDLHSEVEGTTTIISIVDEGTFITPEDINAGKILCELDSSEIKEKLTQQEITYLNAEASLTEAKETLDIQKKQNDSDIQDGERKVKFALMDFKKYLGQKVALKIVEDTNQQSNQIIEITSYLMNPDLGGVASQKLKELEDEINLTDSKLKRAISLLEGSQKLYDANYIAKTELEADQLNVQSLRFQKESAQIALKLFKLYEFPKEAEKLLSDYHEAKRELERIQARARSRLAQANADLESKQATHSLQKERLEKLQKQLDACILRAPAVGEVVYSSSILARWRRRNRMIAVGETVRERQKIISIPDTSEMKVEIKVHETWVDKVQSGQKAKITIASFAEKVFTGQVLKKAPLAEQQNWMNPDLKVYATDVSIDGAHNFLKTGMTAKVDIIIDQLKDVLSVPIQAMINKKGKKFCFVATGKGPEQRKVEIGSFNDNFVEIKSGLAEGEKVLLNPPRLKSPKSRKQRNLPDDKKADKKNHKRKN